MVEQNAMIYKQTTQERVCQFVADFVKQYEMPPSVRMISDGMALAPTTIHFHLTNGVESGRLRKVGKDKHVAYLPANVRIVVE